MVPDPEEAVSWYEKSNKRGGDGEMKVEDICQMKGYVYDKYMYLIVWFQN